MYATPADIRAVLAPDAALPAGTAAELSDASLNVQIDSAQSQVDAALLNRYAVPFDSGACPRLVFDVTVAVAAYLATLLYLGGVELLPNHPVALRYMWASLTLKSLGTGELDLPGATSTSPLPTPSGGATVVNPYVGQLFGPGNFGLDYSCSDSGRYGPAQFYG